jgi:hypothetical protein
LEVEETNRGFFRLSRGRTARKRTRGIFVLPVMQSPLPGSFFIVKRSPLIAIFVSRKIASGRLLVGFEER